MREGSSSNRYEILTKLVEGGMSSIFLARNATGAGVERIVVLKRIIAALANNRELVEMFVHEARLAAQLQHPNIAQVYDVGKLGNSYFFAMEYVHGRTVRELMLRARDKRSPIPIAVVLSIVAGIAAGLHHAHERRGIDGLPLGIVHSDVSPTNVLISTEGVVKLVDFGIARAATGPQPNGKLLGKLQYLSPEQCHSSGSVDRRTDLFSLGIVMWELLTLYSLYRRANAYETTLAIEQEAPSPPSRVRPDVPASVDAIVLKLLAKNPADRYQTAADVLEAIENIAHEQRLMLSVANLAKHMESLFGHFAEPWLAQSETGASRLIIASEPVPQRWSMTAAGEIDEKLRTLSPVTPAPGELPGTDTIPERRLSVEISAELLGDQADRRAPAPAKPAPAKPAPAKPATATAPPRPNAAGQMLTPAPLPAPPAVGPSLAPQAPAARAQRATQQGLQASPRAQTAPPVAAPLPSVLNASPAQPQPLPRAQTSPPVAQPAPPSVQPTQGQPRAQTAPPIAPSRTLSSVDPKGQSSMQPKGPPGGSQGPSNPQPIKPAQAGTLQSHATPPQGAPNVATPPQGTPQQAQPYSPQSGSQTSPPGAQSSQQFVAQSRMQTSPPGAQSSQQFVAQSRMQTSPPGAQQSQQFVAQSRMQTPPAGAPIVAQSRMQTPPSGMPFVEGIRDPNAPRKADPNATMMVDRKSDPNIARAEQRARNADPNRTLMVDPLGSRPRAPKRSKLPLVLGAAVVCIAGIAIAVVVTTNGGASKQARDATANATAKLAPGPATTPAGSAAPAAPPEAPTGSAAAPVGSAAAPAAPPTDTAGQGSAATTHHHHHDTSTAVNPDATANRPADTSGDKKPGKKSLIASMFEAGKYSDVALECVSDAKASDYPNCVVAACQLHDGMHANKWLAKSAAGQREAIVQKCRSVGMNLEMPNSKQGDCSTDPDACLQ